MRVDRTIAFTDHGDVTASDEREKRRLNAERKSRPAPREERTENIQRIQAGIRPTRAETTNNGHRGNGRSRRTFQSLSILPRRNGEQRAATGGKTMRQITRDNEDASSSLADDPRVGSSRENTCPPLSPVPSNFNLTRNSWTTNRFPSHDCTVAGTRQDAAKPPKIRRFFESLVPIYFIVSSFVTRFWKNLGKCR